ncbi:MAG TPA: hypothetical protein DCL61_08775 [Cyanobacteria bacterium UBA12227]|nr:hypothetical protein [Cyanobacteria bacterium UBA12227]HAX85965.1 hypothetical protein [Cyanobacteria bacterium UBA11370]HBY76085.1 hypothetical protein [Cyanobacteria bacterium UBA11148]
MGTPRKKVKGFHPNFISRCNSKLNRDLKLCHQGELQQARAIKTMLNSIVKWAIAKLLILDSQHQRICASEASR